MLLRNQLDLYLRYFIVVTYYYSDQLYTIWSDLQILSQHVTQSNSEAVTENLLFFPTLVGERFGRALKTFMKDY